MEKNTSDFTDEHFIFLANNEHGRYAKNSSNVAHAVIVHGADGHQHALQYQLPAGADLNTPRVHQLTEVAQDGEGAYQGVSADGRTWSARRQDHARIKLEDDEQSVDIVYFSEDDELDSRPFFKKDRAPFDEHRDALRLGAVKKGGHVLEVDPVSVLARDLNRNRIVSQNTIMGESARDAYENFFKKVKDTLSPQMVDILQRAFNADSQVSPENEFRPEWLHAYGFSLVPLSQEPQYKNNLGAAGKWVNTEMMVLERIAKWFALNQHSNTRITINTLFEMLQESELINSIHFEVNVEFQTRFVRFIQDLDAFKDVPVFRKASDVAQAVGITHSLLHKHPPIYDSIVAQVAVHAEKNPKRYKRVPDVITTRSNSNHGVSQSIITIIDLETTGLDYTHDKIIELGLLSFSYSKEDGILSLITSYNELNDPGDEFSEKMENISKITGITKEQLHNKCINWHDVDLILQRSDIVLCHNSGFDRKFLESQTPAATQKIIRALPFGCTLQDINWHARGYQSRRLIDLNLQLGFTYDGHRALNDCWATLNLLQEEPGAFQELISNIEQKKTLLCAVGSPFAKKDLLKKNHFQWSDGKKNIPKCWYTYVSDENVSDMKEWLDREIYGVKGKSQSIPQISHITAVDRYSVRGENTTIPVVAPLSSPFFKKRPLEHHDEDVRISKSFNA